ncbi:cell surface protein SprA [Lishizhenia sp.]|uniref:T9SS outer membrane translocon Sov/SprA n=1 Tax=Lishizhenia sp. TaxID=2497594 RepID=UPI00299EA619|nr:cell surface protein SprA [Lishizhenia sp.]MDX1444764.1 cell surface protein SprA [Lishizhenia sp.]
MRNRFTFLKFALIGIVIVLFGSHASRAQTHPDSIELQYEIENPIDPTQNNPQSFDLGDPSNVELIIEYDPVTGKYVFREKMGDLDYRNPSMMTLEEYIEYERQKEMRDYWKEKVENQNQQGQPLEIPIKIESPGFANVFGSDEINIRPQGAVELSFGVAASRYDNPVLLERQRTLVRFDFQQRIQLNLVGQIGDRMKLGASYNTEAQFQFDNVTKLEYTGDEDQIIQKLEAGNVSMPLNTSLIQGSQTLFGVKTRMKFGRLTVDAIAASSKGQKQTINIEGGAQIKKFELKADNYEANRHYFLNYYHRNHYDEALATVPVINSIVNITRIEVWVTNRQNTVDNTRNILAFTDLGEGQQENWEGAPGYGNTQNQALPDNEANALYEWASGNAAIRSFNNAVVTLSNQVTAPGPFNQAMEYEKVENARKLTTNEFTYNAQLGYISVNIPLNSDEVLAVAYEYTYGDRVYQVGEFSTDGVEGQDALILKLLKPTITNPRNKLWDLMMKNVYSIGAYQVSQDGFKLNVFYNNPETSLPINFLPQIDDRQLVDVIGMDRLNQNNRAQQDGVFDFVPINFTNNMAVNGGTINTRNGRIYFSTIEPFGKTIRKEMEDEGIAQVVIDNVVFEELYDSTQIAAEQIPSKNRFLFKGEYKSSVSSDIPLNALNVPEGAVTVTAGGIRLVEGQDFTVDYNLGRVKILNTGVLESNTPIQIDIESQSVFGFQSKTLMGGHANYMFDPDFNLGATWMMMTEKPITQKVDYGDEPFRNNVIGVDLALRREVPLLTKLVDLLPVISTKAKSTINVTAEAAHLIPGTPRAVTRQGISYVDDFEGSQSTIDLKSNYTTWKLASIPQGQNALFPEASLKDNLAAGYGRAHMAWYAIEPLYYRSDNQTPDHIVQNPELIENDLTCVVSQGQLFPNLNLPIGSIPNLTVMNLAYYPKERGMYNYDTTNTVDQNGDFTNPEERWAGIMRALTTTNFEQTNIEYIQFWMMDPFCKDQEDFDPNTPHSGGDLYFNLGNISEDILPDSRKGYESGLPTPDAVNTNNIDTTNWSRLSSSQVIVNAFDPNTAYREFQDLGLDGWNDDQEKSAYASYVNWINSSNLPAAVKTELLSDISNDNYNFHRDDAYDAQQLDILDRYKNFNKHEGNSPTPEMYAAQNADGYPTLYSITPDIEDINADNNLGESEAYFQYKVSLRQNDMQVGKNYIINERSYQDGNRTRKWYQFRIPVKNPDDVINGITDFRSIRFMRMFMTNFNERTILRFAKLEFIRGEWRRYTEDLKAPGDGVQVDPNATNFNIGAVNIEQHDQRLPIPYVTPPGISREIDPSQTYQRQLNEQALTLEVCELEDGDARAAYRNVEFDVRNYEKLKMFVHAEGDQFQAPLNDDDLTVFIRMGTDFDENYYEYEIPLKVTAFNQSASPLQVWPEENNIEIVFEDLLQAKKERNNLADVPGSSISKTVEYVVPDPNDATKLIKVKGNPNLQGMRTLMIGVRNPRQNADHPWNDDGFAKCAEIWVNELRLSDFNSSGGSAALAQVQMQLADFANVNVAGTYSGTNWGAIDASVSERQRNTQYSFDFSTNAQLGQFLGKKARISVPFYYSYSLGVVTPEFDPFNPDIKLSEYSVNERKERARKGQDYSLTKSFNFTNVRKERKPGKDVHLWDIENFSLSYAQSEQLLRDFNTEYDRTNIYRGGLNYTYSGTPLLIEPLKNVSFLNKSDWLRIIRDAHFYLGPKSIGFQNDLMRSYNERKIRNNLGTTFEFQPIYLKNFTWQRRYNMRYDITKNLKFNITANNNSIFDEPEGQVDRQEAPGLYQQFRDSIRSQMNTLGKTMRYNHDFDFTYKLPLDQIPVLDFMNTNVRYTGGYEWQRSLLGQEDFGNTIQNSRNINITTQMNLNTLYNKVELFKKVNSGGSSARSPRRSIRGGVGPKRPSQLKVADTANMTPRELKKWEKEQEREKRKEERIEENQEKFNQDFHPVTGFLVRGLMSVRTISGSYTLNDGSLLPGYNQETRILGFSENYSAPMAGFLVGKQQRDIWGRSNGFLLAPTAEANGWLVNNPMLNSPHTITHSQTITGRMSLEPLKDVKIDLTMNRSFTENQSEFYRADSSGVFSPQGRFTSNTLTYSTISIGTAFNDLYDEKYSYTFDKMREDRLLVSQLLGEGNPNSSVDSAGYYDGYFGGQQDVVIGAFLTAYSGRSINDKNVNPIRNIPLPNWNVTYNGLSKYKFMKKHVRNFTIRHGYSSTVAVTGMQTNLNADIVNGSPTSRDLKNNFISAKQIQNVSLMESFSPLIGFDATWKIGKNGLLTRFEINKDRSASLSLANNQITETLGNEIIIGSGYKFSDVQLPLKFGGKRVQSSDVNVRFDFSIRDNFTVIRNIVLDETQATAGQKVVKISASADYQFGQNVTVSYYYDQTITDPRVATSYPTGNMSTGLRLRFNLGGL